MIEEGGRFNYSEVAGWGAYAVLNSKNIGEMFMGAFIGIPSMLVSETIDSLKPTSTRAKNCMESYNKGAKQNFQQFRKKMDEIFEAYAEV